MPESDTSTEVNFKLYDKKGKINENMTENKKSSDTDYYFNLLANNDKTVPDKVINTESSEILNSDSESSKETTSVKKNSSTESSKSSKSSRSSKSASSRKSKDRFETFNFNNNSNNNSTKNNNTPPNSVNKITSIPSIQLSPQEIRMKKIELLRKLSEIKQKGFSLTKDYDFNSSIDEMEYEYELLKSFVDKRNGTKIYKSILLNGVSIIEFLNEKYDPFDFHLEGWSEHMSVEADSYDEVLEELYEKYKGTGKGMPPEIKLILLLVASGGAYHFSKSQSTIPGLEAALSKNPELISRLINPQKQKSNFMSPQEINIEKQKASLQQREKELKQKIRDQQMNQIQQQQMPQQQMQMPQMQQNPKMMQPNFMNQPSIPLSNPKQTPSYGGQKSISEIKVPDSVKNILNRIKTSTSLAGTTDTMDSASNNDRLMSDVNVSDSKKMRKNKTIPNISIST
jgi:hypothetical protein